MSFPTGDIEKKYEVLHKLAEGGMGAVYVVRHRLLGELRVIKIIRPHLAEKDHLRERFRREAVAAIRLRHPNIAQIHDFVIDEADVGYSVMELVDGLTLKEILRSGPPPTAFTLEVAAQTLQALGYLHSKGYLHRDVAPDNVMVTAGLDGAPTVKVIDLGLAKRFADELDLTSSGMFVGKVRYAAPEQFARPRRRLTPASDLYAFGIVLYQLLTGVSPIRGSSFEEVIAGHLLSDLPDFSETDPEGRVSPELRRLLLDLLAKDPEKRPASAEEAFRRLAPMRSSEVPSYGEIAARVERAAGSLPRAAVVAAAVAESRHGTSSAGPTAGASDDETTLVATRRLNRPGSRAPRSERGGGGVRTWAPAGVAAVLGLALVLGAWWLRDESSWGEGLWDAWVAGWTADPVVEDVPTAANLPPGRLVVDAVPWARIVRVEDADGREVALDPEGVVTPAVLFLPAGSYALTVEHPSSSPRRLRARVPPGAVERASVELSSADAEGYLRRSGILSAVEEAGL